MKQTTLGILLLFIALSISCSDDDKSWTETIKIASEHPKTCNHCFFIIRDNNGQWEIFDSPITDFNYEEGYEYVLLLEVTKILNPPMDSADRTFKLIEITSKEKKKSEGLPKEYSNA